jgi:hypothetical protein
MALCYGITASLPFRIFLQAYVPRLRAVGDVCTYLRWQRKYALPSSAAFGKIGDAQVKSVCRFAESQQSLAVVLQWCVPVKRSALALVTRQLTLGLISSLPGTAGLQPFIFFSTSCNSPSIVTL